MKKGAFLYEIEAFVTEKRPLVGKVVPEEVLNSKCDTLAAKSQSPS